MWCEAYAWCEAHLHLKIVQRVHEASEALRALLELVCNDVALALEPRMIRPGHHRRQPAAAGSHRTNHKAGTESVHFSEHSGTVRCLGGI